MPVLLDWGLAKTLPENLRIAFSRYVRQWGGGGARSMRLLQVRRACYLFLTLDAVFFLFFLVNKRLSAAGNDDERTDLSKAQGFAAATLRRFLVFLLPGPDEARQ